MNLADFDLNLLVVFEALSSERSVTKAARRLGIRQPAMSASLSRLRVLFGDQLFVRSAGQMRPTAKAEQLMAPIHTALNAAREALGETDRFAANVAGQTLTIASTDYTSLVLMPAVVAAVERSAPNVNLRVIGYDKDEIADLLADSQVSLAVGVFSSVPDRSIRRELCQEHFVGVARRDHPILQRPEVSLQAFTDASHALVSVRRDAQGAVDVALAKLGLRRRVALTLPHILALPQVLKRTTLIAAIPARAASSFKAEGLAVFDLPLPVPGWSIEMLWNAVTAKDKASAWLRAEILKAARMLDLESGGCSK